MSITSLAFIAFLAAVFVIYFLTPGKWQWLVLLAASLSFYGMSDKRHILIVLVTATTIYLAARGMDALTLKRKAWLKANKATATKEEKKAYKEKNHRLRKLVFLAALFVNLGLLIYFKYFHLLLRGINMGLRLAGQDGIIDVFRILLPLGISFYTFQSVGYLTDVYWEMYPAEKNYGKMVLFVSFFPQVTQGPISEWESLSKELFTPHKLDYDRFILGVERLSWGFAKKILLADLLAPYVNDAFKNYHSYTGLTVLLAAFMYSVQIYADFSGYMDIMCGFCQILGIRLTENFVRPYFSKSVAEYWRRWHMSLGTWFKKYIYYPIGMTNWSRKMAKALRTKVGPRVADTIPATIALIVVWAATGLWHGASGGYLAWGLLNGLFIILEMWMEPVYASWKTGLKIKEERTGWRAFQVLRTFILVTFIKVFPEVGGIGDGIGFWKQIFTNHILPANIYDWLPALAEDDQTVAKLFIILGMTVVLFITSMLQRKKPIRDYFNKLPLVIRMLFLVLIILLVLYFGPSEGNGGFMYAQF